MPPTVTYAVPGVTGTNHPLGKKAQYDELSMRLAGLRYAVPCITNLAAARAAVSAIRSVRAGELKVIKLQEIQ